MSQYRLPVAPTDHPDVVEHVQRWLAHVEAGRIGKGAEARASARRQNSGEGAER